MKHAFLLAGALCCLSPLAAQPVVIVVEQPRTVVVHQDRGAYRYAEPHHSGKYYCSPSRDDYRGRGYGCGCPPGHIKNGKCSHRDGRYKDHRHDDDRHCEHRRDDCRHCEHRREPHAYPSRGRWDEGVVIEGGVRFRKRIPLPD